MSNLQVNNNPSQTNASAVAGSTASGTAAAAGAGAASAPRQDTLFVSGEGKDSVSVQSQLATATIEGDVQSHSNIGQVVTDLSAARAASSGWADAEARKISEWGQGEIQRILAQTEALEKQLVAGAREKQAALDASHAGELQKLVENMDLRKAKELKELEDGLQRQMQATLSTSKADINRIETEMNNRKMALLKQAQLKSAAEIDALSNLVVETKLVPSQTRTVIETNTSTGNVVAVATGGNISTGAAQAEAYQSQKIAAVPNTGVVAQEKDVKTGALVQDATGRRVGDAAIVQTMTGVTDADRLGGALASKQGQPLPQQPGTATVDAPYGQQHQQQQQHGLGSSSRDAHIGDKDRDSTLHKDRHDSTLLAGDKDRHVDAAYGKHSTTEPAHKEGLMSKVKHALGVEPKSTDATNRRV